MHSIYNLAPAPWGDAYRFVETFDTKEDAEAVLAALEKVNILFNCYKIVEEDHILINKRLRVENEKMTQTLLRIDAFCRANDIDIEEAMKEE